MEKGFGGPVWHASVRGTGNQPASVLRRWAERALQGVGDAALGEWEEMGKSAFHLRRRLSVAEQIEAALSMRDIRRTDEGVRRAREICMIVPQVAKIASSEIEEGRR